VVAVSWVVATTDRSGATYGSVLGGRTNANGMARSPSTNYQSLFRSGSHQSCTRGWLKPTWMTDTLNVKGVMGQKMASGQKLEPKPIKGKAGSIPVNVQAAHDGANLYLRFSWKQPPGGAEKMDKDNAVKLAFMFEDNKIAGANLSGCWEACHGDARTMPEAKDDKKTKYVKDASLATGKFYDLLQWTSKGAKFDGYVADKRVMEGGKGLIEAKGEKKGDEWAVVFTRKLAGGGDGDIALASGKTYSFGFAIHDDHSAGRFHHVSLGYTLGIDTKADISAARQ